MRCFFTLLLITSLSLSLNAQVATVKELEVEIPTYEFSDPDPLPMLGTQAELYPYFKFSTYSNQPITKKWKVIVMENDYLIVEILPEVGGKVWGITEKKTKYDIIYKNETLKFRNIATRGPWSSGGIEFNFGFFGHTPSAATPVNYKLEKLKNGDVVCLLGSTDLPSRSDWRVKMSLPCDKAYLKIEYFWANTNTYTHPYYYWSNAAVRATDDLVFHYPGTHQIGHGGDAHSFPIDEQGRDLSLYKNNAFGSNKSYHIVGDNKPYKAVYWNDKKVGVGSLANKFNILGKKLWIWSMAPGGSIWENLLTDGSGQYVEIQSGRLYNQASPESGLYTPYTQSALKAYQQDTWCEYWYPVIETGGVSEASKEGVLYVDKRENTRVKLSVMALEKIDGNVVARDAKGICWKQPIRLIPTELATFQLPFAAEDTFTVEVIGTELYYDNINTSAVSKRPLMRQHAFDKDASAMKLAVAEENFKYRRFELAERNYREYLQYTPYSTLTLSRLAEICMRTNRNEEAGRLLMEALQIDTYEGYVNFLFGVWNLKQKEYDTAEECLAVASRMREWKVPSYIEMTKLHIIRQQYRKAIESCEEALKYDVNNLNIWKLLALGAKGKGDTSLYQKALECILNIDGLNTFALLEKELGINNEQVFEIPQLILHNEFAQELLLEQAIYYHSLGFSKEAIMLLRKNPDSPIGLYWLAYLDQSNRQQYMERAAEMSILYVFPYRNETFEVLDEVAKYSSCWKITYYQALYQWMWGNKSAASSLFTRCGNPDFPYFYSIRGAFYDANGEYAKATREYQQHFARDKSDWRIYHQLATRLKGKESLTEALAVARKGAAKFNTQFLLQYDYARLLIAVGQYKDALQILHQIVVLPAEHTGSAYPLYYVANLLQAVAELGKGNRVDAIKYVEASKKWPSNLGGGFGYTIDFGLQELLIAYCRNENVTDKLSKYIEEQLAKTDANSYLYSWLMAYRDKNKYDMQRAVISSENSKCETNSVTPDYVCLKVLQQIVNE